MNKRAQLILGILTLVLGTILICIPLVQALPKVKNVTTASILNRLGVAGGYEQELKAGECITIVDEKSGAVVDKIGHVVYLGDEFINETNDQYRVTRVKGNRAFAKKIGRAADVVWNEDWEVTTAGVQPTQAATGIKSLIAIYHTHSDESYVPTDGSANIPAKGGIFKVGSAMASEFKAEGISVLDDKTPHEPHDANAYHRSRRTALRLLKKMPAAILDVHRDGVPDPGFYDKKIQGEPITKVRMVVGRQNPNMASNLQFAKQVKAYMDKHKPGLIKGIFIGHGSYNQDLSPRSLLLEVGTHTNTRQRAEKGAEIFADAFPNMLGLKATAAPPGAGGGTTNLPNAGAQSRTGWSTLAWIIGIVLIGGAAFLFISTGSVKGVTSKLGELRKTEFANFFGLKKTGKPDRQDKDEK